MASNKTFLWIAAVIFSGALCAFSAVAEVHHPEAYEKLTAVQLKPGHAPRLMNGVSVLSSGESRYLENLPMQLDSPLKKIKKTQYVPKKEAQLPSKVKFVPTKKKTKKKIRRKATRS